MATFLNADVHHAFESCEALVQGSVEALAAFRALLVADYGRIQGESVADNTMVEGVTVLRHSLLGGPSVALRKKAYDILSDSRNALDQAVFAASAMFTAGTRMGTATYFPLADDSADYETLFVGRKARCRDVPPEVQDVIRPLKPWWSGPGETGNDILRTLGKLSGPNKHQVILEFAPTITTSRNAFVAKGETIFAVDPPTRIDLLAVQYPEPAKSMFSTYKSPRGRTDFIQAVLPPDQVFAAKVNIQFQYVASHATRFARTPIDLLLSGFVNETQRAVERIKGLCLGAVIP